VSPAYVVAPLGAVAGIPAYWFVGDMVASARRTDSRNGPLALWRVDRPLRLSFRASGLASNGDIYAGGDAQLVAYGCKNRLFRVTLLVKEPQTVAIVRNGVPYRTLDFRAAKGIEAWRGAIPAGPSRRTSGTQTCTLDVRPTGLLGATQFLVEG
jgi:hypothetical protein